MCWIARSRTTTGSSFRSRVPTSECRLRRAGVSSCAAVAGVCCENIRTRIDGEIHPRGQRKWHARHHNLQSRWCSIRWRMDRQTRGPRSRPRRGGARGRGLCGEESRIRRVRAADGPALAEAAARAGGTRGRAGASAEEEVVRIVMNTQIRCPIPPPNGDKREGICL